MSREDALPLRAVLATFGLVFCAGGAVVALARRTSDRVAQPPLTQGTGAVGATEEPALGLQAVTDDLAAAVVADRSHPLDGALEAVEDVHGALGVHLEGHLVLVGADFALSHRELPLHSVEPVSS